MYAIDKKSNTYDAIVVGSGISGGWAAMELSRKGLKTLLLERGHNVEHIKDYPTAMLNPWDFPHRMRNTEQYSKRNPVQTWAGDETDRHFFVSDEEHPYIQEKPFQWLRGFQVGGRSLTWGRQCYRWSDLDFTANLKDGIAVDWPIRYRDIESWYRYVEKFIGVSGRRENLPQLPDGEFLPPMELNCIEKHLAQSIRNNYDYRILTIARIANLTRGWEGRGPCLYRNLCTRGCPYGGYFSSNSATIPAALSTGNLTLRPHAIVTEVIYDEETERASGVRIMDAIDRKTYEYFGHIIFLNASTIATASILLNSKSSRFPNGLGNDSGELGRNLMDHHSSTGAYGTHEGFKDTYYKGRRPCGFLIPRYQNLEGNPSEHFLRGYNMQGGGERQGWEDQMSEIKGFGSDFKRRLTEPGPWVVWMAGWGECLPYRENKVTISPHQTDDWGQPLVKLNFSFGDNERLMGQHIKENASEMLDKAGFSNIVTFNYHNPGGASVHEMGTARMGHDPKTSVLNGFNQIHSVKNVFITDGSCMTSSGCQNPSLTYMALTARACDYAVSQLKLRNL